MRERSSVEAALESPLLGGFPCTAPTARKNRRPPHAPGTQRPLAGDLSPTCLSCRKTQATGSQRFATNVRSLLLSTVLLTRLSLVCLTGFNILMGSGSSGIFRSRDLYRELGLEKDVEEEEELMAQVREKMRET